MPFAKVNYDELNARQQEVFNFHKVAAALVDYGFNCLKLTDDWQGADFLAVEMRGTTTLKVQLKSRITIDGKYAGKDIWIAFPSPADRAKWYLIEHDVLVRKVGETTNWLATDSWKTKHIYHADRPSQKLLKSIAEFLLAA